MLGRRRQKNVTNYKACSLTDVDSNEDDSLMIDMTRDKVNKLLQLQYNGQEYFPTRSLTPSGFRVSKQLTGIKMTIVNNFPGMIFKLLPKSCTTFGILSSDESKELVCLALIFTAHEQKWMQDAAGLQNKLNFQLKKLVV